MVHKLTESKFGIPIEIWNLIVSGSAVNLRTLKCPQLRWDVKLYRKKRKKKGGDSRAHSVSQELNKGCSAT